MKISKSNIFESVIPTLILELFYVFYLLKMIVGPTNLIGTVSSVMMSIIGVSAFLFIYFLKQMYSVKGVSLYIIILVSFGFLSSLYTGNYRLVDFFILLQYLGLGLILLKYTLNLRIIRVVLFMHIIYFSVSILIGRTSDEVFIGFTRNNIGIVMLVQSILFYISLREQGRGLKIYPAFFTLIFSFWAIGRSGIVVSIVFFGVIVICNQTLSGKKAIRNILTLSFVLTVITVLFLKYYDSFFSKALYRTSLLGMTDPHRGSIIAEYINKISKSFGDFFFGVPLEGDMVFSIYEYNLHNSYLRLHAFHGIVPFVLVIQKMIKAIFFYVKEKNLLYLGLFIVVLMRITTDIAAFHGPFDPLILFFLFSSKSIKRKLVKV